MPLYCVSLLLTAATHVCVLVALYYGRVKNISPMFESDVVLILFPTGISLIAYAALGLLLPKRYDLSERLAFSAIIGVIAMFGSTICAAHIAFNSWGS